MADARRRSGRARLRQRGGDPSPRSGGAPAAAPARRSRSRSRMLWTWRCARRIRCTSSADSRDSVECCTARGAAGPLDDPALSAAVLVLARAHVQPAGRSAARRGSAHRPSTRRPRRRRATARQGARCAGARGHWAGRPTGGIAHGAKAVALLDRLPTSAGGSGWRTSISRSTTADGRFRRGAGGGGTSGRGRQRDRRSAAADVCRLHGRLGRSLTREHERAIALCQQPGAGAGSRQPRVRDAVLGYALVEKGDYQDAVSLLEPVVAELEGFGFPQWQALALTLVGEVRREEGRLDEAAILVDRGLQVTTRAESWYGVGFGHRVAGRVARDRGATTEARAAFEKAADTLERIHATFEARRTRRELSQLRHSRGPRERLVKKPEA